jgi:hypothetical protein
LGLDIEHEEKLPLTASFAKHVSRLFWQIREVDGVPQNCEVTAMSVPFVSLSLLRYARQFEPRQCRSTLQLLAAVGRLADQTVIDEPLAGRLLSAQSGWRITSYTPRAASTGISSEARKGRI